MVVGQKLSCAVAFTAVLFEDFTTNPLKPLWSRQVRAGAVVRWAFSTPAVLALRDELAAGLAWEAFHGAVAKTLARTQARPADGSRSRANAPLARTVYMCVTSRTQSCSPRLAGLLKKGDMPWTGRRRGKERSPQRA